MKKLYTFTGLVVLNLFLQLNINAQAPNWAWAKSAGGAYSENGQSVITDASGNVYITGSFSSPTITFGATTLTKVAIDTSSDVFLVKYDSTGTVIRAVSAGGTSTDGGINIASDATGIYLSVFSQSPQIIFGTDTINGTNSGMIIVKFDFNGNELWAKNISGYFAATFVVIATDASGVYVTGNFIDSLVIGSLTLTGTSLLNMFIAKYDSSGNFLWAKSASSSWSDVRAVAIATDGAGVYVTGVYGGDIVYFSPTVFTTPSIMADGIFVVKYDLNGNALWTYSAGVAGNDSPTEITADASGVYLIGHYTFSMIFGTTTLIDTLGSIIFPSSTFIAKLDANGNPLWARGDNYSWVFGTSVVVNSTGVYLAGIHPFSPAVFGPYTLNGQNDGFIIKYDFNGNMLWAKNIEEGNMVSYTAFNNFIAVHNSDIYITGFISKPTPLFGSTTLTNSTSSAHTDMFIAKLRVSDLVWPGDTDNNAIVDNTDLLPIGLYYGQTGASRTTVSNVWQADTCVNWGTTQVNGYDIKFADCNGDGIIDANDTLAVNLNFSLSHAITTCENDERLIAPDLYFLTSSSTYNAGDIIDVEVWAGSSLIPVNNLYGLSFNINYSSSLVQPGTESITYPPSWFGTPGTDAIKLGVVDALASTAYGAETRINHSNTSGFGKIADFTFQANTSILSPSYLYLSVSGYIANDSAGASLHFNSINDTLLINPFPFGVSETNNNSEISISPNPFTSLTTIVSASSTTEISSIKVYDLVGKIIMNYELGTANVQRTFERVCVTESGNEKSVTLDLTDVSKGIYFVEIKTGGSTCSPTEVVRKKIVKQ